MRYKNSLPPAELLHSRFRYDPATGQLFWKARDKGRWAGPETLAGYQDPKGYWLVVVADRAYLQSRIVWLMQTGDDPGGDEIDHIDFNTSNNQWANLQRLTPLANGQKKQKVYKGGAYKTFAVKQPSGRYAAFVRDPVTKGRVRLGTFDTKAQALAAKR